jgi:type I restriction enzyme, S subunit
MKKDWEMKTLEDLENEGIIQLTRGKVISKKDIAEFPGDYPIYSSAKNNEGMFGRYGKFMFNESLITWSVDGGGRLFYRSRHKFSVTNVGGIIRIKKTKILDYKYLFYILLVNHSRIKFDWVKKAHPSVIRKLYNNIPLPSLSEQKRIVKILDDAFNAIDKAKENAEKNMNNSKELFESYLNNIFNNPGEDWEEKRLKEVCKTGAGGTPLKSHKDYYENGNIPWIRSGEVCRKKINKSELFITEKGLKNSSARVFPSNTVLIAMYGATAGQVGILKFDSATNQAVCGVLPSENLLPEFIYYFFKKKKKDLVKQAVGGAQPNISQIKIKNMIVPVLSIAEQNKIIEKVNMISEQTKKLEKNYQKKLGDLEEMKKSILQKAFNGEL